MTIKTFKISVLLITLVLLLSSFKNIGEVKGWFLTGSSPKSYDIGIVKDVTRNGNVAYLKSIKNVTSKKFGTIMQSFDAEKYKGKRIKLSGFIKTQEVKNWAGMWLRVDGDKKGGLAFDNMEDRKISGTTPWTKYEIILDVSEIAKSINYGVLIVEEGSIWLDDLSFSIVEKEVKTTGRSMLKAPTNSSFDD